MALFIVTGNYTSQAMKGMLDSPSDREAATSKLVAAAGGKVREFYLTTGETDFLLVIEAGDGADMVPPMIVAGASGSVSNLKTVRAYTSGEFKAMQEKAGKLAASFKPAG